MGAINDLILIILSEMCVSLTNNVYHLIKFQKYFGIVRN